MGQESLEALLAEQQELAQKITELRISLTKTVKEDQDYKNNLGGNSKFSDSIQN
jgi:hypothetical protein